MGGTRALFASIGASVALVAAAALSLLAISAVFAFGGWSDPVTRTAKSPALVVAGPSPAKPGAPQAAPDAAVAVSDGAPIVAPAPVLRAEQRSERRAHAKAPGAVRALEPPPGGPAKVADAPQLSAPAAPAVAPTAPAPATPRSVGGHVRKIGESLSSTVVATGTTLADATQPLAPPVSVAVQKALNVVADLVRRTTDGLSTTLDVLLPPKK